jgi:hypothetical protein
MRQVSGLYIGLETADYFVLAYDVIQSLRPVLLDPDLLFDRQPSIIGSSCLYINIPPKSAAHRKVTKLNIEV